MSAYTLEIKLLSDTAFSMGAGVSGSVDAEIQHDEDGLPFISGRTLKGLLVNECSEILFALQNAAPWPQAAQRLFGSRGDLDEQSQLLIGDASLAPDLVYHLRLEKLGRQKILQALTETRHQTAMDDRGAPQDESLRIIRTLTSGLVFYAPLNFPQDDLSARSLLAACVNSLRRAGLGRNRGKGKLKATITGRSLNPGLFSQMLSTDIGQDWFKEFKTEVLK